MARNFPSPEPAGPPSSNSNVTQSQSMTSGTASRSPDCQRAANRVPSRSPVAPKNTKASDSFADAVCSGTGARSFLMPAESQAHRREYAIGEIGLAA